MRKHLLAAGIAAITLIPTLAAAQQTCEERRSNRVAGTVVGGVLGAIAGSAVAGHGDRNEGAVKALQHRAVRRLGQLLPEGVR